MHAPRAALRHPCHPRKKSEGSDGGAWKSSASIRFIGSISRYHHVRPQYIAAGTICRIFVRIGTFETAADGKIRAYPARRADRSKGIGDVRLTPCPLSTFVRYHSSRKSSRRQTRLANAYTQL